jgi:hypothetical protein
VAKSLAESRFGVLAFGALKQCPRRLGGDPGVGVAQRGEQEGPAFGNRQASDELQARAAHRQLTGCQGIAERSSDLRLEEKLVDPASKAREVVLSS